MWAAEGNTHGRDKFVWNLETPSWMRFVWACGRVEGRA